eukprot:TRINITY_DN15222_c0_g1_i1.p1 TRINITY_DN15222_c0_g1~~TRINITY_DN15222_c0_g1_i1.p1  ORF type:complete len:531 (-),score=115.93 TRINITY_DN15222_c0_g1_i1:90-1526(-)
MATQDVGDVVGHINEQCKRGIDLFDLVPERYPDTISAPDAVRAYMKQKDIDNLEPIIEEWAKSMPGQYEAFIPLLSIALEMVDEQCLSQDAGFLNCFSVSPMGASGLANMQNMRYQQGTVTNKPQPPPPATWLKDRVEWKDIFTSAKSVEPVNGCKPSPVQGFDSCMFPDPSKTKEYAHKSAVVADMFNRLSSNFLRENEGAEPLFSVSFKGKVYTKPYFLARRLQSLYDITSHTAQRIANFFPLSQKTEKSRIYVPFPAFILTGMRNAKGEEAAVPAVHSERVWEFRDKKTGKVEFAIRWFTGTQTNGTRFYPQDTHLHADWLKVKMSHTLPATASVSMLHMASLLSSIINTAADRYNLYDRGYGIIGVCNDAVAVLEQAYFNGDVGGYPLVMQQPFLLGEIKRRLEANSDDSNTGKYRALWKIIQETPNDLRGGDQRDTLRRILASIPYKEGEEPFVSTVQARAIVGDLLDKGTTI